MKMTLRIINNSGKLLNVYYRTRENNVKILFWYITISFDNDNKTRHIKNTEILNSISSNKMKLLKVAEFREEDPLLDKISHPTLKDITKYRNHSSIIAIRNVNRELDFHFSCINVIFVLKSIKITGRRSKTEY